MNTLILAAAYIRMSTDMQDMSPERQRGEIEKFAERRGYKIIKWYEDLGISGSRDESARIAFQQMLLDSNSSEWKVILCVNMKRFGRQDSISGAFAKDILRKNGVVVDTVQDGGVDWRKMEDRFKDAITSELGNLEARTTGKESLSGRMEMLDRGAGWPHGKIPYGYDRLYTDGTIRKRNEKSQWQKSKDLRLKLVENKEEADIVRWIYDQFVNHRKTVVAIARKLNEDKIPSPGGVQWNKVTVRDRLRDKAYIGFCVVGKKDSRKKTKKEVFTQAEKTEKADQCPPLISKPLWESAQAILDTNKLCRSRTDSRAGILSGMLFCGHCMYCMQKDTLDGSVCAECRRPVKSSSRGCSNDHCPNYPTWTNGKASATFTVYGCPSKSSGRDTGCAGWTVQENYILHIIKQRLAKQLDEEVIRMMAAVEEVKKGRSEVGLLQGVVDTCEKRRKRIMESILGTDDAMLRGEYQKELKQILIELEGAGENLRAAKLREDPHAAQVLTEYIKDNRHLLFERIHSENVDGFKEGSTVSVKSDEQLRAFFRRLGLRATLWFERTGGGDKRGRYKVDEGSLSVECAANLQGVMEASTVVGLPNGLKDVVVLKFDVPLACA